MKKKKMGVEMIVVIALMVALHIIFSRFLSINAWNMKIGFAFIATYVSAYLYGPIAGIITGALGDFLGAILFPIGPYFPGFTLNCALSGLVMGILLHKKQNMGRMVTVVLIDQLLISLLLTTYWISVLYGSEYLPLVASRLLQVGVMTVLEILGIYFITKILKRIRD